MNAPPLAAHSPCITEQFAALLSFPRQDGGNPAATANTSATVRSDVSQRLRFRPGNSHISCERLPCKVFASSKQSEDRAATGEVLFWWKPEVRAAGLSSNTVHTTRKQKLCSQSARICNICLHAAKSSNFVRTQRPGNEETITVIIKPTRSDFIEQEYLPSSKPSKTGGPQGELKPLISSV